MQAWHRLRAALGTSSRAMYSRWNPNNRLAAPTSGCLNILGIHSDSCWNVHFMRTSRMDCATRTGGMGVGAAGGAAQAADGEPCLVAVDAVCV